ncbi:L-rhamnose mutarotase [Phototrophicus methaneseepsis]|uniref:L-rhamnose mutarotase n=1 Tax=Phototrophicus methaneseepsis TaxID=2710758 RepID=A0A7S8E9K3_9CHLR|nr:L-rhamnose mutarotase [Phototrophicus methaneseepsis]QPC82923.1 L-rhamnose mutarotase [Phototrophicus methaneseepsis]
MKRVGFILKVKQDLIDEYKEHHRNVWPEMKEALSACGWKNYSLFMREDGTIFGYFETQESLEAAIACMEGTDVNERWQAAMAPYFEIPEGARPDQTMMEIEEVFHID